MKPKFKPGKNIAIKVPPHQFEQTVSFYRDIIGLEPVDRSSADACDSIALKFGDKNLWIDRSPSLSQAEIWLEIRTEDMEQAAAFFEKKNIIRCDDIEPLPGGFWISSPSDIIHLVTQEK